MPFAKAEAAPSTGASSASIEADTKAAPATGDAAGATTGNAAADPAKPKVEPTTKPAPPAKPDDKTKTGRFVVLTTLSLDRRKVPIGKIVVLDDGAAKGLLACKAIAPEKPETE